MNKTLDELRAAELLPFQAGIAADSDLVMIGHLICTQIDNQPATFSYKIVTDLLRGELGFDGVVITDGLQMGAMTNSYTGAQIALNAINAGCDLLATVQPIPGNVSTPSWTPSKTAASPRSASTKASPASSP